MFRPHCVQTVFLIICTLSVLCTTQRQAAAAVAEATTKSTAAAAVTPILHFTAVTYSPFVQNVTYVSNGGYDDKGMGPLYAIANFVLTFFYDSEPIPKGYIKVSPNTIAWDYKVKNNQWTDLLFKYWPILFVAIILAIVAILMPIIGFCFCCCRCAGKCGGRSQPFDKKYDTARRVVLGFFLIVAATGLTFGVVVAFATSFYLNSGIYNATTTGREGIVDTQQFLHTTSKHANHLLVKNYAELAHHFNEIFDNSTVIIQEELDEKAKYKRLIQAVDYFEKLSDKKDDLTLMRTITIELRNNATLLNDELRSVKRDMMALLQSCSLRQCTEMFSRVAKLNIGDIDYDSIPNTLEYITAIDTISINDIITGKQSFDNIKKELQTTLSGQLDKVMTAINETGDSLTGASNDVTKLLMKLSNFTEKQLSPQLNNADDFLEQNGKYGFYVGLTISSILLLILMFVVFGLCCGICGKRPDGYGDDCCNKGTGSRCLMWGVAIIFLTISIMTVIVLILFVSGLVFRRGVCLPLSDPSHDQIFGYLDRYVDLNSSLSKNNLQPTAKLREISNDDEPLKLSEVISLCHQNETIYKILRLKNVFNVDDVEQIITKYGINDKLNELLNLVDVHNIQLLTADGENMIRNFAESDLSKFDMNKFQDYLTLNITTDRLDSLAQGLKETADRIGGGTDESKQIVIGLRRAAETLSTYQRIYVNPMTAQSKELLNLAESFEQYLFINQTTLEKAMLMLIGELKSAEEFLNKNGTVLLRQIATELVDTFKAYIKNYLTLITKDDIGKCGPLSNVYNSSIVAVCNRVVDPYNGLWIGIFWCLLLFIPTICISSRLSTLYQKSDPYPGPLVESEYMYDAYNERDNIPMTNGPKNKRKKKHERRRSSRDRRGDYYEDTSSPHGPSSCGADGRGIGVGGGGGGIVGGVGGVVGGGGGSGIGPREARYNDMAPKHWDSGPPRYQNPPVAPPASEYERPPPYYYPGAPNDTD